MWPLFFPSGQPVSLEVGPIVCVRLGAADLGGSGPVHRREGSLAGPIWVGTVAVFPDKRTLLQQDGCGPTAKPARTTLRSSRAFESCLAWMPGATLGEQLHHGERSALLLIRAMSRKRLSKRGGLPRSPQSACQPVAAGTHLRGPPAFPCACDRERDKHDRPPPPKAAPETPTRRGGLYAAAERREGAEGKR